MKINPNIKRGLKKKPEANEIKRKINKYFPDCAVLNNNFINICREDPYKKFEIYRSNAYEKDLFWF